MGDNRRNWVNANCSTGDEDELSAEELDEAIAESEAQYDQQRRDDKEIEDGDTDAVGQSDTGSD